MNIRSGQIKNEAEMVRDLKRKGCYSSGVPRQSERAEKRRPPFRYLSRRELQSLSPDDFQRYIEHADACERSKS